MDDTSALERSEEKESMAITSKGEEVPAEQWRRWQHDFGNQPVSGRVETQGRV